MHLAVLQGDAMMTLAKREARHAVRVDTGTLGKTDAPHATATGKAMLAWLPEDEMRRMLAHGMARFTPNTITELPALIEELRHVRRNGYAIDDEEYQPGVICVGAAIRDHNGAVVGAISASTPTMRATDEHLDADARGGRSAAARALSAELGGPGSQSERPLATAKNFVGDIAMYAPAGVKTSPDMPVPDTMKAWVLGDPGELKLTDKPVPVPKRAEVLVRIDAVAICATDLEII